MQIISAQFSAEIALSSPVESRTVSHMKRSRLALAVVGAISVFAVGGVTVAQAADPPPNPKASLPANIHGKDPNAQPIAPRPAELADPKPPTKEELIEAAKKFKAN